MALDRRTGRVRWQALDDRPGYSSPVILPVGPAEQLVVWTADNLAALEPKTGRVLWRVPFRTSNFDVAIISPVFDGKRIFVSGYWDGALACTLQGNAKATRLWKSPRLSCLMSTPLSSGKYLYVLDKRDGFLCIEWHSGKVRWTDHHLLTPKGRNPHAALVWAKGRDFEQTRVGAAVALNSVGELVLLNLTPARFEDLGRVKIIEGHGSPVWAHPAFSGQDVYARSHHAIVRTRILP